MSLDPRRYLRAPRRLRAQARFLVHGPTVPASVEPPEQPKRTGVDFETKWARKTPARLARRALQEGLFEPVVTAVARPTAVGLDRLAGLDGSPVVFAANHFSHADTPILLRTIPAPWRHRIFVGAAADYFFPNRLAGTVSALALNAIPIERTKVTRRSALDAAALLDEGWSMLIYPEGGRSPDGWGQPFRGGASYLSIKCGVPVVPIAVEGTRHVLPKGKQIPRPHRVTVTFGEPIRAAEGEDSRTLAARIEAAVAALVDEHETDWYSARLRFYAGGTPSLNGPDASPWRRSWARSADDQKAERRPSWPRI